LTCRPETHEQTIRSSRNRYGSVSISTLNRGSDGRLTLFSHIESAFWCALWNALATRRVEGTSAKTTIARWVKQRAVAMTTVLQKPDYARVKREVRRLHEQFVVTNPPVDPARIARGIGVSIYFVIFEPTKQNISGFFDCDESAIFVNKDEYPLRQTFTIAHELGHKILHEEWAKSNEYRVLLRDSDLQSDDFHEKEANAFAAHLLVPRFLLDRYWQSLSAEQLSTLFAVSVPMIKNRLSFEYGIK
jgi:Zn-dependent peptidase ImmA (M78 family)